LVGADYFLTPMGCDIFSLMGIKNIATWLKSWLEEYADGYKKCSRQWNLREYRIRADTQKIARFAGYTVQQYITKSKEGKRRATKAFEKTLRKIPHTIRRELAPFLPTHLDETTLHLPDVPHMYSLVPLAQNAHAPLHRVVSGDGLVGAQYSQQLVYVDFIKLLSQAVRDNLSTK
jgi:hypothetical protein